MTVGERISDALIELGVIGPGDTPDDDDFQLALRHFQMWSDALQADRLALFTVIPSVFALTANQQIRTIGFGGHFNVARPMFISHIGVTPVGQTHELTVVPYDNREAWLVEPWKTQTDLYPYRYLYEPEYPLGKLTFWPVPTTAAQVSIALPQALAKPVLLTTVLEFPPGYDLFYHLGLTKALIRPFKVPISNDLQALFADLREARGAIVRNNDEMPPIAMTELGGSGGWDIRSGSYRRQ